MVCRFWLRRFRKAVAACWMISAGGLLPNFRAGTPARLVTIARRYPGFMPNVSVRVSCELSRAATYVSSIGRLTVGFGQKTTFMFPFMFKTGSKYIEEG